MWSTLHNAMVYVVSAHNNLDSVAENFVFSLVLPQVVLMSAFPSKFPQL
jgi:hypothetical protein